MSLRRLIFIGLLLYGAYYYSSHREVRHDPGILAPEAPIQSATDAEPFTFRNYTLTPLNDFEITARVLSVSKYFADKEADISPIDLALGWGSMSNQSVIDQIDISQSGRFYFWRVKTFPIPRKEIETNSANMHMVPENDHIEDLLKQARAGQVITIKGYLIQANGQNGYFWKSSQTRNDTGRGACELIFVRSVRLS